MDLAFGLHLKLHEPKRVYHVRTHSRSRQLPHLAVQLRWTLAAKLSLLGLLLTIDSEEPWNILFGSSVSAVVVWTTCALVNRSLDRNQCLKCDLFGRRPLTLRILPRSEEPTGWTCKMPEEAPGQLITVTSYG